MSRFLDAMRERGNRAGPGDGSVPGEESLPVTGQTADDKTIPSYKGQIVDVDDVLGAPVKSDDTSHSGAAVETAVDSGGEAISHSSQAEEQTPQLSIQNDESSASRVSDSQSVTPTPDSEAELNTSTVAAVPQGHSTDNIPGRQKFGLRSLDPLFYLIVGIAALGLFGSLYALITQNDAYFEREYQQLQKESAALQARLAASASLQSAEGNTAEDNRESADAEDSASTEVVAVQVAPIEGVSDATVGPPAVPAVPVLPVAVDPIANTEGVPVATAVTEASLAVQSGGVSDSTDSLSTDQEANGRVFDLLRQEVEGLRALIAVQDDKIHRLQQDKQAVSQSAESGPGDQVAAETGYAGVVQPDSFAAPAAGDESRPSRPVEVRRTPVLSSPQVGTDGDIDSLVNRGYLAYQATDYVTAGQLYQKALQFDPYHRDANLGVAAVAQINGRLKLSEDRYRHLLTLNPADAVAFSALLNLGTGREGAATNLIEYELAQHARYVDKPQMLYAILGNYYSQQRRWLDAEQAYSVAVTGDLTSADSLFNYAVSLDNLGRFQQAADLYSKALTAASYGSYSFEISAAQQRLKSIDTTSQ